MNRRKLLTAVVLTCCLAGAGFVLVLLLHSLGISAKTENDSWSEYDLVGIRPGELRKLDWAWVYRRTDQDKKNVRAFIARMEDPLSLHSRQPENARNEWRSGSPEFFIFLPFAPIRGCGVKFMPPGELDYADIPEADIVKLAPYFSEPCEGRVFDTSGRLFRRQNYPPENNLIVPDTQWVTKTKVLVRPW